MVFWRSIATCTVASCLIKLDLVLTLLQLVFSFNNQKAKLFTSIEGINNWYTSINNQIHIIIVCLSYYYYFIIEHKEKRQ